MMRSMFSGVSGLRAHQTKIDVISNNIANVNTVAFKSGRVTFQEVFNQTLQGASAPDATTGRGGTNPLQIGLSTAIGSIDNIMTRGSVQRTDNPTDLSIDGEGFFIVKAGNNDAPKFTRAGNFSIDKQGNIVTSSGLSVCGWNEYNYNPLNGQYDFNTESPVVPLNIYQDDTNGNKRIMAATATKTIDIAGNLSALAKLDTDTTTAGNQPEEYNVPITVYDNLGNDYTINVRMFKSPTTYDATHLVWNWSVDSPVQKTINGVTQTIATTGGTGTITFDVNGKYVSSTGNNSLAITPNTNPAIGPVTGASVVNPTFDFSKVTQYSMESSVSPNADGYQTGQLVSFSIGPDGVITGVYTNSKQKPLGMVGLAFFENPAGLLKEGQNLFSATTNSGTFEKAYKPGSPGLGELSPGTLEMSNVDLSTEFTEMITTERGFQASSKIITTSDEMLQELVNIKR